MVRDGRWKFGGEKHWHTRSPFAQAKEGKFSLLHWLQRKGNRELANLFMWHAVVFPFAIFRSKESPEWHEWEVVDKPMYDHESISRLFENILKKAWEHFKKKNNADWCRLPNEEECAEVAEALRPKFEFFLSPKEEQEAAEEKIKNYTEEQYKALDSLEFNERVLFDGPSGTGKTLLAVEAARRGAAKGLRTLLVCHSRYLGKWLEKETKALAPWITADSIFNLEKAAPGDAPHDQVIVDEAQDILNSPEMLNLLDTNLLGGLDGGRWRMFADTGSRDFGKETTLDELNRITKNYTRYALRTNCRNSPGIASFAVGLRNGDDPYDEVKRGDGNQSPKIIFYDDNDGEARELGKILDDLKREGFSNDDAVILSVKKSGESIAKVLGKNEKTAERVAEFSPGLSGKTGYCSVWDFKGLEKGIVIITDIDTPLTADLRNLLYIGATRALQKLYLLVNVSQKGEFKKYLPASQPLTG
jgi:Fe-S cluster biosynthesis and repair protein YggX